MPWYYDITRDGVANRVGPWPTEAEAEAAKAEGFTEEGDTVSAVYESTEEPRVIFATSTTEAGEVASYTDGTTEPLD